MARTKGARNLIPAKMLDAAFNVFKELQKKVPDGEKPTALLAMAKDDPKWFYATFGLKMMPAKIEIEHEGELTLKNLTDDQLNAQLERLDKIISEAKSDIY